MLHINRIFSIMYETRVISQINIHITVSCCKKIEHKKESINNDNKKPEKKSAI